MNASAEVQLYDEFASRLQRGEDVVDHTIYDRAVTLRKNLLISSWLPKEPSLVLDYGCGSGESTRFLAHLSHQVVALDVSKDMIRYAKRIELSGRISYLVASGEELPFRDGVFDVVIGIGIFHHINLLKGLQECHRSLKPKGGLELMEPNTLNPFSFIGRRAFRTTIHTPQERTYTLWFLRDNIIRQGFEIINTNMTSFVGYSLAFLSARLSSGKQLSFRKLVALLRKSTGLIVVIDRFFESLPLVRSTCWIIAMNTKRTQ